MENLIQPYKPEWKKEFEDLKNILNTELKDFQIDLQHVGSTAIPGLCAKPILDIDIIITDKSQLDNISERLVSLGYLNKGEQGIQGRFAFRQISEYTPQTKNNRKWQEHHLYVCYSDSTALKNHILFRNALLNDNKLVEQYAQLKMNLVKERGMTREKYTKQKTEFILSVLATLGLDKNELNEITKANA